MAAPKRKPPKRLFKTTDRVSRFEADKSKRGMMKRMAREHEEVLEVIERACVTRWREYHDVDDHLVDLALHAAIVGETPDDPAVAEVSAALAIGRAAWVTRPTRSGSMPSAWFETPSAATPRAGPVKSSTSSSSTTTSPESGRRRLELSRQERSNGANRQLS